MNFFSNSYIFIKFDLDKVVFLFVLDKYCFLGFYDIFFFKLIYYDRFKVSILMNGDIKFVFFNSVFFLFIKCLIGIFYSYINVGKGYVQLYVDGENNYFLMEGNKFRNNSDSVYYDMLGGYDFYLDMIFGGYYQVEYDIFLVRFFRVFFRFFIN